MAEMTTSNLAALILVLIVLGLGTFGIVYAFDNSSAMGFFRSLPNYTYEDESIAYNPDDANLRVVCPYVVGAVGSPKYTFLSFGEFRPIYFYDNLKKDFVNSPDGKRFYVDGSNVVRNEIDKDVIIGRIVDQKIVVEGNNFINNPLFSGVLNKAMSLRGGFFPGQWNLICKDSEPVGSEEIKEASTIMRTYAFDLGGLISVTREGKEIVRKKENKCLTKSSVAIQLVFTRWTNEYVEFIWTQKNKDSGEVNVRRRGSNVIYTKEEFSSLGYDKIRKIYSHLDKEDYNIIENIIVANSFDNFITRIVNQVNFDKETYVYNVAGGGTKLSQQVKSEEVKRKIMPYTEYEKDWVKPGECWENAYNYIWNNDGVTFKCQMFRRYSVLCSGDSYVEVNCGKTCFCPSNYKIGDVFLVQIGRQKRSYTITSDGVDEKIIEEVPLKNEEKKTIRNNIQIYIDGNGIVEGYDQDTLTVAYSFDGNGWVSGWTKMNDATYNYFSIDQGLDYSEGLQSLLNKVYEAKDEFNQDFFIIIADDKIISQFQESYVGDFIYNKQGVKISSTNIKDNGMDFYLEKILEGLKEEVKEEDPEDPGGYQ